MICDCCGAETPPSEIHEHAGRKLCDDCYMDAMRPATGCDPWAVYLATRTKPQDQTLSPVQKTILSLVQVKDRVKIAELLEATGLDEAGLRQEIVTLRHMEKVMLEKLPDQSLALKRFPGADR
ncbi:MAG: hypothetical protein AB1896_11595 [Thermodesulfobacteriota bacterium]